MKKLLPNSIFTLSLFVLILVCYFSNKNIKANVLDLKQKIYLENLSAFCSEDSKKLFKCTNINHNPITGIIIFPRFGKSILISEYKDGYEEGKSIIFDNTGVKKIETIYKNGELIDQKFYYPNGKISLEIGNNIFKGYYENGQVHFESLDGIYKEYDKTGKLLKTNKTN